MSSVVSAQAVELVLRHLVATTPPPPSVDMPAHQVILTADAVGREREQLFAELRGLLAKGAMISDTARRLLDELQRADQAWRSCLEATRERMTAERARANAPRGRASAYRTP